MKVLHVITRLILGGAQENTLLNCIDLIHEHGDDVLLVTGPAEGPEGDLFDRARAEGVPVEVLSSLRRSVWPIDDFSAYRSLGRIIDRFGPDVVHTHSSKAGILGRRAAWKRQVPAVVHTIHGLPFHPYQNPLIRRLYIAAERDAARRCHRIISVADAMTRQALAVNIGSPDQFITIYSGMDVEPYLHPARDRDAVRSELGIPAGDIVLMKVARLFELKGHDDVIAAAPEVLRAAPGARFVFVGGGTWEHRLKEKIAGLGLEDRFLFTGLVPPSRIPELLSAADIVVHASYREGLARVLPQALIAGRPVISYDVDGAPEVILPERTGLLVAPGDVAGLAKAMTSLALRPDRGRAMGEAGRELFTDRFRHDAMTRQIRQVYMELLERR